MRENRITKAYTAAWKWPEVYTTAPSLIWTSRAIAFLLPISLAVLLFITVTPLYGIGTTAVVIGMLVVLFTLLMINIFYQEYDTVEDFQSRETRIKEFFRGFPSITDVPLIELGRDEWVAYGHIPPKDFTMAIAEVILYAAEDHDRSKAFKAMELEESVGHLYAVFKNPDEEYWSEGMELSKATAENSFPITRLEL